MKLDFASEMQPKSASAPEVEWARTLALLEESGGITSGRRRVSGYKEAPPAVAVTFDSDPTVPSQGLVSAPPSASREMMLKGLSLGKVAATNSPRQGIFASGGPKASLSPWRTLGKYRKVVHGTSGELTHRNGLFSPPMTNMRDIPPPITGIRRVQSMPALSILSGALHEGKAMAMGEEAADHEKLQRRLFSGLFNDNGKAKIEKYDMDKGVAFGSKAVDAVNDGSVCVLMSIAHQLGLFAVMAKMSDKPQDAATIAAAANNLRPRYVQELLSGLTCAGIVEETRHKLKTASPGSSQSGHGILGRQLWPAGSANNSAPLAGSTNPSGNYADSGAGDRGGRNAGRADDIVLKYVLPAEHAVHLTWGHGQDNLALLMQYVPTLARLEDEVVECFRSGAGLDWTRYGQFDLVFELDTAQTIGAIGTFEAQVLQLAPGLPEALRAGTSILCLGSGVGSTIASIALAYPKSWFTVYETNEQKTAAASMMHDHIANLHFAALPTSKESKVGDDNEATSGFATINWPSMQENRTYAGALVLDFSVIRDAASPAALLTRAHDALRPGCSLIALEYVTGGGMAAPLLYCLSGLQSVPLGIAAGGPALGRGWGADSARRALLTAGFTSVGMHRREGDDINVILVATASSSDK